MQAVFTETVLKMLCSFWLPDVVVYFNVKLSPQQFRAAAHIGNGFSQESQKTCDPALPAP